MAPPPNPHDRPSTAVLVAALITMIIVLALVGAAALGAR